MGPPRLIGFGEGGVWGLGCWPYESLFPGGRLREVLGPLALTRGPLTPGVPLGGIPGWFPPTAGDELLVDGSGEGVGE